MHVFTVHNITQAQIELFKATLPVVTDEDFRSGGAANSASRWHRICHAALGALNATTERHMICMQLNSPRTAPTKGD